MSPFSQRKSSGIQTVLATISLFEEKNIEKSRVQMRNISRFPIYLEHCKLRIKMDIYP